MGTRENLLYARFHLNMRRIDDLTNLIVLDIDSLRPTGLFQSEGVRADILRTIVVFLHATFEDVLRSMARQPNKKISFYSGADIDKVLRQSGLDPRPFKPLYPPLTQMAKRRKRIVHEADLSKPTDTVSEVWTIVDDWQLIMWLMAVRGFYYQLRISVNAASAVERAMCERLRKAMQSHVDFGNQLRAFPEV
jgi:hypothetical protein